MGRILEAHSICVDLEQKIKQELKSLPQLCLASVAVGIDYAAQKYRSSQEKTSRELGIKYLAVDLPADTSFDLFKSKLEQLNSDKTVTGIIINKPFPSAWRAEGLVDETKDVEGVNPVNLGKFLITADSSQLIIPPTVNSILKLLDAAEIDLKGKKVTLVGFSSIIGKPLALLLASEIATVTITHKNSKPEDFQESIKGADVIISATGKPQLIKGSLIKQGAVVIDVGTGEENGKLCGDVEFDTAKEKAAVITPVPGGVGRLTTMCLFENLVLLAKKL